MARVLISQVYRRLTSWVASLLISQIYMRFITGLANMLMSHIDRKAYDLGS